MTASVTGLKAISIALSASLKPSATVSGTETHTGLLAASAGLSAAVSGRDVITPTDTASIICTVHTGVGVSAILVATLKATADAANVFAGFPYFPGCPVIATIVWERGGVTMDPQVVGGVVVQKVTGQAILVWGGPGQIGLPTLDRAEVTVVAEELADVKLAPC
jgi:hypothetical protein